MEATFEERKSADNCSSPQGYRLSIAIADHALSGFRYLTYTKHLSQLSMKVTARCKFDDWPEQNGQHTLKYSRRQELDSRPAVWCIEQTSIKLKEKKLWLSCGELENLSREGASSRSSAVGT